MQPQLLPPTPRPPLAASRENMTCSTIAVARGSRSGRIVYSARVARCQGWTVVQPVFSYIRWDDGGRGYKVWPLFGMAILAACLIALVTLAVWVLVFILLAALAGLHAVVEAMTDPEAVTSHPGLYLALLFAELLLAPVMAVLGAAPAIAAYQTLAAEPD